VHLDEPHSFTRIQQYAYYKLIGEGIHVKNKARVTLFETGGGFVSIPESVLSGVNMILVISKEGSDSGLLHRRQVPVQHPYLKRLTVEQIIKTDLEEGTGIVYDDERYIEFINGKFQAIFLSFEK
jgi:hypothetical protein